jgi:hypothetical protein
LFWGFLYLCGVVLIIFKFFVMPRIKVTPPPQPTTMPIRKEKENVERVKVVHGAKVVATKTIAPKSK